MNKRILSLIIIILVLTSPLYCVNLNKQYSYNSKEYQTVLKLAILSGVALPSSSTPVSGYELLLALNRINVENLPKFASDLYKDVYSNISEHDVFYKDDIFQFDLNPSIGLEAYVQTSNETWISSNDWVLPYKKRLKLIDLPVEIGIKDYFYGVAVPEISVQFNQPNLTPGKTREENQFAKIFSYNADISLGLQRSMPFIAEAVLGNNNIHFFIGRDSQSLGHGYTGNLILGDNFLYQDFAKLSIHSKVFSFNYSITYFDRQKNTKITDNYSAFDSTQLENFTFSGRHQIRVMSNYQITVFDKATISFNFGNLFDSDSGFDLRLLNPFMITHNYFNFTTFNNNYYNEGAALEANNHFSASLSLPIVKGWSIYSELMIDQMQLIGEKSSTSTEPPNAIGLLLNITNSTILRDGILTSYIEGVYTSPNLYLNEKYIDNTGKISNEKEDNSEYYYWNQDLIVGNSVWWGNDLSYSGYINGPDSIVLSLGSEYEKDQYKIKGIFTYKIHGEQGIRWHERQNPTIHYTDSVWNLALTGVWEHTFIGEVQLYYNITNYVSVTANVAGIYRINNRNELGAHWQDMQLSIGVRFFPMKCF